MQRSLLIIGILLILVALAWPWLKHLPLGRLPGDIVIERPGYKFFFPITTMILVGTIAYRNVLPAVTEHHSSIKRGRPPLHRRRQYRSFALSSSPRGRAALRPDHHSLPGHEPLRRDLPGNAPTGLYTGYRQVMKLVISTP